MLISGIPPFDGRDDQETYSDILHGRWDFDEFHFRSVSSEAKDFITRCLTQDPDIRPSSEELMSHPWFDMLIPTVSSEEYTTTNTNGNGHTTGNSNSNTHTNGSGSNGNGLRLELGSGSHDEYDDQYNLDGIHVATTPLPRRPVLKRKMSEVPGEIVDRLRNFEKRTMLTKICMEVIAHSLSSDQITDLKHEFAKFDPLCTGEISHANLHDILRASKFTTNISELDLNHIIDGIDLEHSGKIRYHEFIAATLSENMITDNNLQLAFEKLSNHHTYITKDDFLDLIGTDGSVDEIDDMFRENNMSPNHTKINFKQFKDLMRKGSPRKRTSSGSGNTNNSNTNTNTVITTSSSSNATDNTTNTTTTTTGATLVPVPPMAAKSSTSTSVLDSPYRKHKQRLYVCDCVLYVLVYGIDVCITCICICMYMYLYLYLTISNFHIYI